MSKPIRLKLFEFNKYRTLLLLYCLYWGVDDHYDLLVQAASTGDEKDIAYRARKILLELPNKRQIHTSGYYILESIGKE
jgi:hypothetical protein